MKSFIKKSLFLITAHLLIFSSWDVLFSWHYFLKKKASISGVVVRAGDVGSIYGTDLTPQQKKEIQETIMADSPLQDSIWNAETVRSFLDKKHFYPESIRGTEVELLVPTKEYSIEELQEAIQSAYSGWINRDYKIVVKSSIKLPEKLTFKVKIDGQKLPGEKVAFFTYKMVSSEKSIKISYTLLKSYTMIVATSDLNYGDRLTSKNMKKNILWMDHPVDSVFLENPLGYVALGKINKDAFIMPSDVVKKVDVNNGDSITLEYTGKNLLIQASVRACESGSIGEIIKFRTLKNKIIYGEILSRNKANYSIPVSKEDKWL